MELIYRMNKVQKVLLLLKAKLKKVLRGSKNKTRYK
jgi:hypothetical protein